MLAVGKDLHRDLVGRHCPWWCLCFTGKPHPAPPSLLLHLEKSPTQAASPVPITLGVPTGAQPLLEFQRISILMYLLVFAIQVGFAGSGGCWCWLSWPRVQPNPHRFYPCPHHSRPSLSIVQSTSGGLLTQAQTQTHIPALPRGALSQTISSCVLLIRPPDDAARSSLKGKIVSNLIQSSVFCPVDKSLQGCKKNQQTKAFEEDYKERETTRKTSGTSTTKLMGFPSWEWWRLYLIRLSRRRYYRAKRPIILYKVMSVSRYYNCIDFT